MQEVKKPIKIEYFVHIQILHHNMMQNKSSSEINRLANVFKERYECGKETILGYLGKLEYTLIYLEDLERFEDCAKILKVKKIYEALLLEN